MTMHVIYDHECPQCGAYYIPYDHDVPCPKCGIVEENRFDYITEAALSMRFNKKKESGFSLKKIKMKNWLTWGIGFGVVGELF